MFKRSIIGFAGFAGFLVMLSAMSMTAFGQIVVTSGKVELLKDDESRAAVGEAIIEAYRTDTGGGPMTGKVNKKGEFQLLGLVPGGLYALVISGPGIKTYVATGVKAGQEQLLVTVRPGDGKRLSEAEVRAQLKAGPAIGGSTTSGSQGEESDADKKKKAEYDAEVARISSENEKKQKANQTINASLTAGTEAFNAGMASIKSGDFSNAIASLTTAVSKFNEGYEANPTFAGSAPVLLNNKGIALRQRALATFNKAVKETDATVKADGYMSTQKDLTASAECFKQSLAILATATPADIPNGKTVDSFKLESYKGARDTFKLAVQTEKVDPQLMEIAKTLTPEYVRAETDAAAKIESQMIVADLFRIVQDRESAITAYKAVLEVSQDNMDAIGYLGLVLVDLSWLKDNDKTLAQDGANYLQRFVAGAPDTHKLKEGAKGYLDILKAQSIVPVKSSGPAKKKP